MTDEARDKILIELRTALVGIDGTEQKGLVGEVREMKNEINAHFKLINGHCHSHSIEIHGLKDTVYGKDDKGGLVDQMKQVKELSKRCWILIIIIAVALIATGVISVDIFHIFGL